MPPLVFPVRFSARGFLAWACLFCCLGSSSLGRAETKRALLIAINTYETSRRPVHAPAGTAAGKPGSGGRWDGPVWHNLDGALNDLNSVHELLISSKFGFADRNIHMLRDSQATREQILAAMRKYLLEEPAPGDTVVFYYAGHGSQRYNSRSEKPSHLDETMVPADANTGVFDVRDKEIARLLNQVVDKGIRLTAIFDSCHSGSIARGIPVGAPAKARFLPYDPRDANDPPDRTPDGKPVPRPEDRPNGALILSATQSDQLASEWSAEDISHGAFTVAVMDALRVLPADAPAQDIYKRVKVLMQGMGLAEQQPTLAGPAERRQAPLLGPGPRTSALTVAVRSAGVSSDGTLGLDAGLDLGLGKGSELKKVGVPNGEPEIRVRITSAELGRSKAELLPPAKPSQLEAGDLLELDKWVPPEHTRLKVWMPPANLSHAQLAGVAAELRKAKEVVWVDDPLLTSPTHIVAWNGSTWTLSKAGAEAQDLGATPTAEGLLQKLGSGAATARVFLQLSPSKELKAALDLNPAGSVEMVAGPEWAQYLLVGRAKAGRIEYAWVQKNLSEDDKAKWSADERGVLCSPDSPYPPRTDWVEAGETADAVRKTSATLTEYAYGLARVRAWLELPVPPGGQSGAFPYRLALRKLGAAAASAGKPALVDEGPVFDGESYGLVLQASGDIPANLRPKWVYVLGIECNGEGHLLYPLASQGNLQPQRKPGDPEWPRTVELTGDTERIDISAPYGIDTYVLLTTSDQLSDLSAFNFKPVLTRGAERGSLSPLTRLLEGANSNTRGMSPSVPANWSVQYLPIRSMRKPSASAK